MRHRELHRTNRIGWLRAAVLGANDGIVSTASLVVGVAAHRVRLLHPKDHDHFAMLRRKLHWAETPDQLRPAGAGADT